MVYPSQNEVFGILDSTGPVLGCPGQEGSDRINGEWIKGLVSYFTDPYKWEILG